MHNYDEDDDRSSDDIWNEVGAIKNSATAEFKAERLWLGARFTPPASFFAMKPSEQKEVLQRVNHHQLAGTELALEWNEITKCFDVVDHQLLLERHAHPQPA